jgi:hypothetical protein
MNYLPFAFEPIAATTWAYLASLLMLGLFFKFNRCWSIRNLDLFLIILLAPGLLMIDAGRRVEVRAALMQQSTPSMESNDSVSVPVQTVAFGRRQTESNDRSPSLVMDPLVAIASTAKTPLDAAAQDESRAAYGQQLQRFGYIWLFSIGGVFLLRSNCSGVGRDIGYLTCSLRFPRSEKPHLNKKPWLGPPARSTPLPRPLGQIHWSLKAMVKTRLRRRQSRKRLTLVPT